MTNRHDESSEKAEIVIRNVNDETFAAIQNLLDGSIKPEAIRRE